MSKVVKLKGRAIIDFMTLGFTNFKTKKDYLCTAGRLIALLAGGRKVRAPEGSIAGNARHHAFSKGGQVQQKVCTGNAVVKPGKLCAVKCHVYRQLRAARPMLGGRQIERSSNAAPR